MKKTKISNSLKFKIIPNFSIIVFIILFILWIAAITNKGFISIDSKASENLEELQEISGIANITDGDTIKIDNKRIRLLEIDAPETSQNCFNANYEEYACGKMSKDFLVKLADQKQVKCYYKKFDKYGRYLAKCYIDNIMINAEMIKNGMAVTYFFGTKNSEMTQLENEAKENELGIWQGAFQMPKDYRKTHKNH